MGRESHPQLRPSILFPKYSAAIDSVKKKAEKLTTELCYTVSFLLPLAALEQFTLAGRIAGTAVAITAMANSV